MAYAPDLGSGIERFAGSNPVIRTKFLHRGEIMYCTCCGGISSVSYNAYDNFCDPYRYSQNVDGKYIKYNQHSCLKCRCGRNHGCDGGGSHGDKTKTKYLTEWTGKYPDPYRGMWRLTKNGKDISNLIPTWLRCMPMYTYGEYPVYYMEPGMPIESFVCDGFKTPEWVRYNLYWINIIADDEAEFADIYEAFHANDWRFAPIAPPSPFYPGNCVEGYFVP